MKRNDMDKLMHVYLCKLSITTEPFLLYFFDHCHHGWVTDDVYFYILSTPFWFRVSLGRASKNNSVQYLRQ